MVAGECDEVVRVIVRLVTNVEYRLETGVVFDYFHAKQPRQPITEHHVHLPAHKFPPSTLIR